MCNAMKEVIQGMDELEEKYSALRNDMEAQAAIAEKIGLTPEVAVSGDMLFISEAAGRDNADEPWNSFGPECLAYVEDWLYGYGSVHTDMDENELAYSYCCRDLPGIKPRKLFIVVMPNLPWDDSKFSKFRTYAVSRIILQLIKESKEESEPEKVNDSTVRYPINNLGELRAAVAACEGLPDTKTISNQVVGENSGAWNLAMDFIPRIPNSTLACFSMSHPNLIDLPMDEKIWKK